MYQQRHSWYMWCTSRCSRAQVLETGAVVQCSDGQALQCSMGAFTCAVINEFSKVRNVFIKEKYLQHCTTTLNHHPNPTTLNHLPNPTTLNHLPNSTTLNHLPNPATTPP